MVPSSEVVTRKVIIPSGSALRSKPLAILNLVYEHGYELCRIQLRNSQILVLQLYLGVYKFSVRNLVCIHGVDLNLPSRSTAVVTGHHAADILKYV